MLWMVTFDAKWLVIWVTVGVTGDAADSDLWNQVIGDAANSDLWN